MSKQLFNNHNGHRGKQKLKLTMAELYDIVRERLNYVQDNFDPDAVCQNICCEIEKKMGIYPNIPGFKETDQ